MAEDTSDWSVFLLCFCSNASYKAVMRLLFPEPDTPVIQIRLFKGRVIVMFLRLLRATFSKRIYGHDEEGLCLWRVNDLSPVRYGLVMESLQFVMPEGGPA